MDYIRPYGSTQATSPVLSPCDAVMGPLLGVIDLGTGVAFCNTSGGGFVSGDPYAGNNPATGAPWLTSDILRSPNPDPFFHINSYGTFGFNPGYPATTGWDEWFAQAFAIEANPDTVGLSNTGVRFDLDQIVRNGYFPCTGGKPSGTTGWARSVYLSGNAVANSPNLPSGCGLNSLPSWWPGNLSIH